MIPQSEIRNVVMGLDAFASGSISFGDEDDLFERGLDSFGSVQLMLALEDRFGIEFPDHLLSRRSFSSIRAIHETVSACFVEATT